MRDSAIVALHEAGRKRDGLILAQHEFLKTRQEAMETAIVGSSCFERLRWIFQPARWLYRVDAVQRVLMQKEREKMARAMEKREAEDKA